MRAARPRAFVATAATLEVPAEAAPRAEWVAVAEPPEPAAVEEPAGQRAGAPAGQPAEEQGEPAAQTAAQTAAQMAAQTVVAPAWMQGRGGLRSAATAAP